MTKMLPRFPSKIALPAEIRQGRKLTMGRALSLLLLAAIALSACAGSVDRGGVPMRPVRMPQWALAGEHPDYPSERFIVAYGLARDVAQAERMAEEALEAEITALPLIEYADYWRNTQFSQLVHLPAAWITADELGVAVQREYAGTGFESVVLCAISRENLRLFASSLLPQARERMNKLPEPPSAGTPAARLEAWGEYFLASARVLVLNLIVEGSLDREAFRKAEIAAQRLWEVPSLIRVAQAGSGGRAAMRGGVEDELVLYARFRGEPVSGVPLRWKLPDTLRGVVRGDDVLGKNGEARARVLQVSPNGADGAQVFASVDLDRLLGRRTGVQMPAWFWGITLPSRNNSELLIEIEESIEGAAKGAKPQLVPGLQDWAQKRGQRLSMGGPATPGRPYRLKVTGSFVLRSFTRDNQATAYTSGQLELVDMDTGNVLFTYLPGSHRTGEPGLSETSVALSAQREAVTDGLLELISRIQALLPAPEDYAREGS